MSFNFFLNKSNVHVLISLIDFVNLLHIESLCILPSVFGSWFVLGICER